MVAERFIAVGEPEIEGCPKWSWYVGPWIQGGIYPLLVYLAFREKGFDLLPWLDATWSDYGGDFFYERLWFYAFAG